MTGAVALKTAEDCVVMNGGELNGNGMTITYSGERVNDASVGVLTTTGGRIVNLTVNGADNGRALYVTKLTSDLNVSNCTFSGAYAFNLNSADKTGFNINFTNTVFNSWTSYANVIEQANFTDCRFAAVLKPYGDTVLTNCEFTVEQLDVSALEAGETITMNNCTYNGTVIEKAVVQIVDGALVVSECDLFTINEGILKIKP